VLGARPAASRRTEPIVVSRMPAALSIAGQ
jgi:hypothetical protein